MKPRMEDEVWRRYEMGESDIEISKAMGLSHAETIKAINDKKEEMKELDDSEEYEVEERNDDQ